jgi:uncharacterized protein YecE (DUF72 family)
MASILVGSCSWTDPTLIACGRFYPPGVTGAEDRLRYYATQFPLVEVDSTYYAPPSERNSRLWVERTPEGFVFNVKAYGLLTGHPARTERLPAWLRDAVAPEALGKRNVYRKDVAPDAVERLWEVHRAALEPLRAARRLGAALFQFPPWFTKNQANEAYLREIPDRLPGVVAAVEFRGGGWMAEGEAAATLSLLEDAGLAYVSVDEPQGFRSSTPTVVAATAPLAVVRLHGRNAETWEARTSVASDRFKYLYSDAELEEWVPRVRDLERRAEAVHVLFNNNYEDWGMRNARRMTQLLGDGGRSEGDGEQPGGDEGGQPGGDDGGMTAETRAAGRGAAATSPRPRPRSDGQGTLL